MGGPDAQALEGWAIEGPCALAVYGWGFRGRVLMLWLG